MPTTLPGLNLQLPVRGTPGNGLWGDTMDANLTLISPHDHGANGGAKVKTAGIQIDSDLTFSQTFAPKDLHRVQFSSVAALSDNAQNKSLFVSNGTGGLTANELYWRNSAGNHVKLTTGNTLNVASFAGGISGDFTSAGAAVTYDDALKRYIFKEGTADSNAWARVYCGGLRLAEFNSLEGLYVEQLAPAALAASYAMTWPLALPAAAVSVSVDNTGAIAFGASQALATNNSYSVSGTGKYKHGTKTLTVPVAPAGATTNSAWVNAIVSGNPLFVALPLVIGTRVTEVRVRIKDSATGPTKLTMTLQGSVDGVLSTVATSAQSSGAGTAQTIAMTGLTSTVTSGTGFQVKFDITTGATSCSAYWIEVDYDQP